MSLQNDEFRTTKRDLYFCNKVLVIFNTFTKLYALEKILKIYINPCSNYILIINFTEIKYHMFSCCLFSYRDLTKNKQHETIRVGNTTFNILVV